MTYPVEALYDEITYIAFHFGWSRTDILDLEHAERLRYVRRIRRLDGTGVEDG